MTVNITRAATLSTSSPTIGDLAGFIAAAEEVGATAATRVAIVHVRGDQRDPDYYTLTANA